MKKKHFLILTTMLVVGVLASSCGWNISSDSSNASSANAEQPGETTTSTDLPSETPLPPETSTPTPNAAATLHANLTSTAAVEIATEQAVVENYIYNILRDYGIVTTGQVAQFDTEKLRLVTSEFNGFEAKLLYPNPYRNFVFYTEVEWKTESGLAGCGIDLSMAQNGDRDTTYQFYTLRLDRAPAWGVDLFEDGVFVSSPSDGFQYNDVIEDQNFDVNAYLLMVQDGKLSMYINYDKIRDFNLGTSELFYIFPFTYQESGKTECIFKNSWLVDLDNGSENIAPSVESQG